MGLDVCLFDFLLEVSKLFVLELKDFEDFLVFLGLVSAFMLQSFCQQLLQFWLSLPQESLDLLQMSLVLVTLYLSAGRVDN